MGTQMELNVMNVTVVMILWSLWGLRWCTTQQLCTPGWASGNKPGSSCCPLPRRKEPCGAAVSRRAWRASLWVWNLKDPLIFLFIFLCVCVCLVFFAISVYIHMHENVIICTCVSEGGGSEPNPGARWGCFQAQETGSRTAPTEGLSWKGQGTREPLSPETRSIVTHHDKRL